MNVFVLSYKVDLSLPHDDENLIESFVENTSITKLTISLDHLDRYSVNQFMKINKHIIKLNISISGVDNTCFIDIAKSIATNNNLHVLNILIEFSDYKIINKFIDELCKSQSLNEIVINICHRNDVTLDTDTNFYKLLHINRIKKISLMFGLISNSDIIKISEILSTSTSQIQIQLKKLKLYYNELTSININYLMNGLKKNTSITDFNLCGNNLDDTCYYNLVEMLSINNTLQKISVGSIAIDNTTDIRQLINSIHDNDKLTSLKITNKPGNDFSILGTHKMLKKIRLSYCDSNYSTFFYYLCNNNKLETLDLPHNKLTRNDLSTLATTLKINHHLKNLNLSNNDICADNIMMICDAMEINTSIQSLNLNNNLIKDSIIHIARMIRYNNVLLELEISKCQITNMSDLSDALIINTTLTNINISHNKLQSSSSNYIVDIVRKNNVLKNLNIMFTNMGVNDCINIANALIDNSTLRVFKITNDLDGRAKLNAEKINILYDAFSKNYILTNIVINLNLNTTLITDRNKSALHENRFRNQKPIIPDL